jgi:hypothetical protein
MAEGICKLCGEKKKLCEQSHIIPNFLYKDLKKEEGHFYLVKSKDNRYEKKAKIQTGEFDKHILCQKCENEVLSRYEKYGASVLKGGVELKMINKKANGVSFLEIGDIDYAIFKLFILSILWKASISKRDLFKEISLGPYEKVIGEMILNGNPGKSSEFPFLIFTYLNHKDIPSDLITQPRRSKYDGGTTYNFLVGGMSYTIFISKHIIPDFVYETTIKEDNTLKIIYTDKHIRNTILKAMTGLDVFRYT